MEIKNVEEVILEKGKAEYGEDFNKLVAYRKGFMDALEWVENTEDYRTPFNKAQIENKLSDNYQSEIEEEQRLLNKSIKGLYESLSLGYTYFNCLPNLIYSFDYNFARFKKVVKLLDERDLYAEIHQSAKDELYLKVYLEDPKGPTSWKKIIKDLKDKFIRK